MQQAWVIRVGGEVGAVVVEVDDVCGVLVGMCDERGRRSQ